MTQLAAAHFATTRWSLVLNAGQQASAESAKALETLCSAYWFPLYAYARRRGYAADDAADLTQEFFLRLFEKQFLESADPERGRFRTFLLTIFQRFLLNERDRDHAAKRGGGLKPLTLDFESREHLYAASLTDGQTAERIFERQWAMTLLSRVVEQLRAEYLEKNKLSLFENCRTFLIGSANAGGYSTVAAALNMSEGALRVAVHRLRERYRELLRQEVSCTIEDGGTIDDELNSLRLAIREENQ